MMINKIVRKKSCTNDSTIQKLEDNITYKSENNETIKNNYATMTDKMKNEINDVVIKKNQLFKYCHEIKSFISNLQIMNENGSNCKLQFNEVDELINIFTKADKGVFTIFENFNSIINKLIEINNDNVVTLNELLKDYKNTQQEFNKFLMKNLNETNNNDEHNSLYYKTYVNKQSEINNENKKDKTPSNSLKEIFNEYKQKINLKKINCEDIFSFEDQSFKDSSDILGIYKSNRPKNLSMREKSKSDNKISIKINKVNPTNLSSNKNEIINEIKENLTTIYELFDTEYDNLSIEEENKNKNYTHKAKIGNKYITKFTNDKNLQDGVINNLINGKLDSKYITETADQKKTVDTTNKNTLSAIKNENSSNDVLLYTPESDLNNRILIEQSTANNRTEDLNSFDKSILIKKRPGNNHTQNSNQNKQIKSTSITENEINNFNCITTKCSSASLKNIYSNLLNELDFNLIKKCLNERLRTKPEYKTNKEGIHTRSMSLKYKKPNDSFGYIINTNNVEENNTNISSRELYNIDGPFTTKSVLKNSTSVKNSKFSINLSSNNNSDLNTNSEVFIPLKIDCEINTSKNSIKYPLSFSQSNLNQSKQYKLIKEKDSNSQYLLNDIDSKKLKKETINKSNGAYYSTKKYASTYINSLNKDKEKTLKVFKESNTRKLSESMLSGISSSSMIFNYDKYEKVKPALNLTSSANTSYHENKN